MSGEHVLRNRGKAIGSVVCAIIMVLIAADLVAYPLDHTHAASPAGDWVGAAAALVVAAIFVRIAMTRVVVTDGAPTFVVKNVLKTHEIAWSDVQSIGQRQSMEGGRVPTLVIKLHLRDGRSIRCIALGGGYRVSSALETELETMLADQKAKSPGGAPT